MDLSTLNYWAVLVAAVSSFVIGGLWYSPVLFANGWMAANKFSAEDVAGGNKAMIFGGAFVLNLIMAFNLAAFLGGKADLAWGVTAGALAGIGWVACSFGVTYLFERRPAKLFFINAGYHAVAFMAMGAILGAWK